MTGYPGMRLSDERVAVLAQYNERLENGPPLTDAQFADFMRRFRYLGPLDAIVRTLTGEAKKRILSCAALCHVAASGLGRDYLNRHRVLHLADRDSAEFLSAVPPDILRNMLANASIGDRCMIVLTLPEVGLRVSPGAAFFGSGEHALSVGSAKMLLIEEQADGTSLLEKFAGAMQHVGAPISDMAVWNAWYALIRKCIDDKAVGSLHGSEQIHSALGKALKGLIRRVSGDVYRDPEPFCVHEALKFCVEAYSAAGDWKGCGKAYLDLANHYRAHGERDLESNCYRLARVQFVRGVEALWGQSRTEAMKCYELGREACRRDDNAAAERVLKRLMDTLKEEDAASVRATLQGRVDQVEMELSAIRQELDLANRHDARALWDARSKRGEMNTVAHNLPPHEPPYESPYEPPHEPPREPPSDSAR
ncbi:hypothetical protein AB870_15140 [Pandoraea faecigallinarum]|nr:hypothetical protein AB870_15140 [Pandoraea faecigallinarum]